MKTRDPRRLFTTSQRVGADSQGFRKPRRDPGPPSLPSPPSG